MLDVTPTRLAAKGELWRVRKGLYWKGTPTPFGMSRPRTEEVALQLGGSGSGPLRAAVSVAVAAGNTRLWDGAPAGGTVTLEIMRQGNTLAKKVEVVEYEELGMEAVWKIEVEDFPAFIVVDDKGNDFFAEVTRPVSITTKG